MSEGRRRFSFGSRKKGRGIGVRCTSVLGQALRTISVAFLGTVAVACSLLIDLADTTGGSPSDAASDVADRQDAIAEGDAAAADGGAAEGGDASDAGRPPYPPGSWCAENAPASLFCDDFDEGALGARWTGATLQVSGAATLSTASPSSTPNAFDIACPALTPSTFLTEALTESIPAASRVTMAFDFDPLAFPADGHGGTLYLATMTQGPGTPRNAIQFRAGTALVDLQEQVIAATGAIKSGTGMWASTTLVPSGSWTRIELVVDFTTSPAKATLRLAGQTVATGTLDATWTRAPATFYLGDWYIPTEPAFHVAYDNVTIDVEP